MKNIISVIPKFVTNIMENRAIEWMVRYSLKNKMRVIINHFANVILVLSYNDPLLWVDDGKTLSIDDEDAKN